MKTEFFDYVTSINYTCGYYQELNPQRIKLAFINKGIAFPDVGVACELGFGQGISTNFHAAASIVQWYGTDFNASQVNFAQTIADAAQNNAKLYNDAFIDFAQRTDLPEFDYICLHGIWSWISEENRTVIVDFIKRKLKVGGILYLSYNCLPGWAAFMPIRHLMKEHVESMGSGQQGLVKNIKNAVAFAESLVEKKSAFIQLNPSLKEWIKKLNSKNAFYLAHEYFNTNWQPMHFSSVARLLREAQLNYVCSASYLDDIDAAHLTAEQQTFLNEMTDPIFREDTRDFMVNRVFRRDYWVKGAQSLTPLEQMTTFMAQRVILIKPRAMVPMTVTGILGESQLNESIYNQTLDILEQHTLVSVEVLSQSLAKQGLSFKQMIQILMILVGNGSVALAQTDEHIARTISKTNLMNKKMRELAVYRDDVSFLVSPVIGEGVYVSRFQQLFLTCIAQGIQHPDKWAEFVWKQLSTQGHKLVTEGKTLQTAEENMSELINMAESFAHHQLPILKALKIV